MRELATEIITEKIKNALIEINHILPADLQKSLQTSFKKEKSKLGKYVLAKLIENAQIAKLENIPICQDTGLVEVFIELGQEIQLKGASLNTAINNGITAAYIHLRKSIVVDPLQRVNTNNNTPGIIYTNIVPGNKVIIQVLAKGGGAENKSALKMLDPTAEIKEIKDFVLETVSKADAAACPPYIIGIGIGGSFDYCPILAKKALLRQVGSKNKNKYYQKIEKEILQEINHLGIGPAGYGGKVTALAVHIATHPCHIASLPVAVNMQCHAARHKKIII